MIAQSATDPATSGLLPALLIVAGVIGLGVLLAYSIRGRLRIQRLFDQHSQDMTDLAARVDKAQQLSAELDVKSARLAQLIAQANDKAAGLSRDSSRTVDEAPSHSGASSRTAQTIESTQGTTDPVANATDLLAQSIYELTDAGLTPLQVAQQLREETGKITLILALRRKADATELPE